MPALQTPGAGGGGLLLPPSAHLLHRWPFPTLPHSSGPKQAGQGFSSICRSQAGSPPPFWVESLTLLWKPFRSAQGGKVRAVLRATACLPSVTATHGARSRCLCGLCASLSSCWTPAACPPATNVLSTAQIRKRRQEGVGLTQDTGAVEQPRRSLNLFQSCAVAPGDHMTPVAV